MSWLILPYKKRLKQKWIQPTTGPSNAWLSNPMKEDFPYAYQHEVSYGTPYEGSDSEHNISDSTGRISPDPQFNVGLGYGNSN